jgi:hypothetical protein
MDFNNLQNSYIVYYLINYIIWTLPNIDVCIIYPWKKIEVNCIGSYILFYSFKMKIVVKKGLKLLKRTQKDIYINIQFIFRSF